MDILVTGAAGFIGSRVAGRLLDEGHTVVGIDILNDAYDPRLKEWRLAQLEDRDGFRLHRVDIGDRQQLGDVMSANKIDAVINLAARAGVRQSLDDPWVYYQTNLTGTLNLLDLCRELGIKKFVLSSTSSTYGDQPKQPFTEDMPTDRPVSPYAASKKAAEVLTYTYHDRYGIDATVFRYFTVFGPAGRPDMSIFRFIRWVDTGEPVHVFGDGSQKRDFTFVEDVARGTIAGLTNVGYEIINLGNNKPASLLDVIKMIEEKLGKKAEISFEAPNLLDVPSTWADISKAERLLGWTPETTTEQGIGATADWYLANLELGRAVSLG
jgi:nucleoside-diphosphate-sugar epimerase